MNGLLTDYDKARLAAIRSVLDMMVDEIGAADEASFNAKAAEINKKAAAIPVLVATKHGHRYEPYQCL